MAVNETLVIKEIMSQMPADFPAQMSSTMFFMIPLILILLLVSVLGFVAWIWMVVDCAKRNKFRSGDRVVWILLLVLTGILGMILYYFMVMREE